MRRAWEKAVERSRLGFWDGFLFGLGLGNVVGASAMLAVLIWLGAEKLI